MHNAQLEPLFATSSVACANSVQASKDAQKIRNALMAHVVLNVQERKTALQLKEPA